MDDYAAFASSDALFDFGALPQPPPSSSSSDPRSHSYPPFAHSTSSSSSATAATTTWPLMGIEEMDHDPDMSHHQQQQQRQRQQQQAQSQLFRQQLEAFHSNQQHFTDKSQHQTSRPSSNQGTQPFTLQPANLSNMNFNGMLPNNWQFQMQQAAEQQQQQRQHQHQQQQQQQPQHQQQRFGVQNGNDTINMNAFNTATFGAQLQQSPVDFMPATSTESFAVTAGIDPTNFISMTGPMESMNVLGYPLNDYQNDMTYPMSLNTAAAFNQTSTESVHSSIPGGSPTGTALEVQSLSDGEGSWSMVNYNSHRQSFDSTGTVSNPSQNLHIRTNSDSSSDGPGSACLSGSYEEVSWPLSSPHDLHGQDYLDAQFLQHTRGISLTRQQQRSSPTSSAAVSPTSHNALAYRSYSSTTTSPTSSGPVSPPLRRRKSPLEGKTTKAVIKKSTPQTTRKESTAAEKKVGRRKGPLRPDQRQQAHEIRKLRACLRCKFLKKTCDKGEPCGGCRPSHARLWQVPCTRMDIKDISYFMKDWKADYERHVSLGFSVGNIKGFSALERTLYITHGYGHYLPINAREVFVRDDQCFEVDWRETTNSVDPEEFIISTAKLSAGIEGVSTTLLSEYLDRHLDQGFEYFVDAYFEGTKFLTEILKTAYRYYLKEQTPSIRKALKLVLAYNLTLHITMVEGLSDEEQFIGRINDDRSKFYGKTAAPVMINFQIKCALADMWRELQKDILEELSALYSSVYSGDKLKNWPTIFMLAAILLAIWEEMQFDCHFRVPDEAAVQKFCDEMETTPVGVIVGLFQAISTKLPGLQEWDTKKHHQLLGSNPAVCDALTEVRSHINKHEKYLRERSSATFTRDDTDCLSNRFLSKLVIRAN